MSRAARGVRPRSWRAGAAALAAALSVIPITGCAEGAGDSEGRDESAATNQRRESDSVEFPGPWAAEFAEEYRSAESDLVRQILRHPAISVLYYSAKRNPDNRDEHTIIAECLVRVGVRDSGYSAEDYARESDEIDLSGAAGGSAAGTAAFHSCLVDPLDTLGQGAAR